MTLGHPVNHTTLTDVTQALKNADHLTWRIRRSIVAYLPQTTVTAIAEARANILAAKARRSAVAAGLPS